MYSYISILLLATSIPMLNLLSSWSWVIDFSIMNLVPMSLSFSIFVEKYNSAFVFTVLVIFTMVYWYSFSYLSSEVYLKRFLLILTLFAGCMCILILSSNLFSSLVGWDGLGVTSLFLILFYYSKSTVKAGTLTFLMNRSGDCFFILALTQVMLLGEQQVSYTCSSFPQEIILLIILTSITKSAQIPFSTWLPAAMEAPTPVSALVHSSTLVTAGIYLLYRYSALWLDSSLKDLLMILSVGTCFMAALSALVENDLKKLIALSTLSQLGFVMFSFSLGLLSQGFMHMLMHAFFKALLFMCAGLFIHSFSGSQTIMSMGLSKHQNPLLMVIVGCSLMSMSGLPFLSGFYSKDLILDSFKDLEYSCLILFLLVASFLCTITYSVRVTWYLWNSGSSWHSMSDSDLGMIKPMIPLALLASIGGSTASWLLVEESSAYVETSKVPVLVLLCLTALGYWCLKEVSTNLFLESKWGLNAFNPLMSSVFFQNAAYYKYSSDLLGIPEILNKKLKSSLDSLSTDFMKTMVHYSGNLEFLLFVLVVLLLM